MATFGFIGEFDPSKGEIWERYIDRLSQYFEANAITDNDRKRAILNSVVGPTTYGTFCKILFPKKPTDCSFQEISDAMKTHSVPVTSVIVERCKFFNRVRQRGESVSVFAAELKASRKV